jgi:histone arginine demethylase JMJD6
MKGEDDEAIHYFMTILPRIKRKAELLVREGMVNGSGYEGFECWEFTQFPGETVFIPHGW